MMRAVGVVAITLCLCTAAAVAQVAVPPPPKPADSGPSLEVTMKFIQDKLNEQRTLNYAAYTHNNSTGEDLPVQQIVIEITNAVADPSTCRITWHKKTMANGNVGINNDLALDLHTVETFEVRSSVLESKLEDAAHGVTTIDKRQDPPYFVLVARSSGNHETPFFFREQDLADRLAKAMVHAVELCGGGNKDPF